jgi:hypothetical protein
VSASKNLLVRQVWANGEQEDRRGLCIGANYLSRCISRQPEPVIFKAAHAAAWTTWTTWTVNFKFPALKPLRCLMS